MADTLIADLPTITGAGLAAGDYFVVEDVSALTTSKITKAELAGLFDAAGAAAALLASANTWSNTQLVSVASASAVVVGPNGATNPTLKVVTNVASAATGLSITGNAAGSGVTLTALSSGTDESIILTSKGAGRILLSAGTYAAATPHLSYSGQTGTGISWSGNSMYASAGGSSIAAVISAGVALTSTKQAGWCSGAADAGAMDTGLARSAAGVVSLRNGSTAAGCLSSPANTPTQIAADQNNYSPGVGWFQRWSSDASRNVTGMAAGVDGETRHIWNVGAQNIVLQNENASSTAANRFANSTGADITLAAAKCALAMYDNTSSRWRVTLLP